MQANTHSGFPLPVSRCTGLTRSAHLGSGLHALCDAPEVPISQQQPAPRLTDRRALNHHRHRAQAWGGPVTFLLDLACAELKEKIRDTGRKFAGTTIISGYPGFWYRAFPDATMIADLDRLEFPNRHQELIIHAMALHWSDDPVGQLIQCRLALQPDGLLIAAFMGGSTLNELREALLAAESEVAGRASPHILPMGDVRDFGAVLQRAGFALPVADRMSIETVYADMFALMHDLRRMGETNALAQRARTFTGRQIIERAAELYAASHSLANGKIKATFEMIFLTGWAPAKTQPKPLKPGSAIRSLNDVLSTDDQSQQASAVS